MSLNPIDPALLPYFIISLAALTTAGLTLFSGFGLGTLFLPVFALFFPLELAVALTALVHLANNLFKLGLLGKYADKATVLRFGLPAILAALLGAWTLLWLSDLSPWLSYQLWGRQLQVTPVKLVVALLMIAFALMDLIPALAQFSLKPKYLPLGGLLSGFFGGLSGHQGALRSVFLLKCGLSKEAFIGTGVVIACLVDLSRLSVYFGHFSIRGFQENAGLLIIAIASAFTGSYLGSRLLTRITIQAIQYLVAALLLIIALGLASGFI
ncbi:MAG: sulfite exporter TauE/SafE family protein [Thermodesulfobacteriota bacterium]